MGATSAFYIWFFTGLSGLGGWFIFLLLALVGVLWLFYDSSNRRIPALGWRMGAFLIMLMLVPTMIYRFSSAETQFSLFPFQEAFFYLGLLGGILPVILAIGYYVTYQGMLGCNNGHVFDKALGQCPECARINRANYPPPPPQPPDGGNRRGGQRKEEFYGEPLGDLRPKANAWLVMQNGKSYQLCKGETTVGRLPENDIQFSGETSVSRRHAKIQEIEGRFYLTDIGSSTGTMVNGRIIRQRTLLEPDDEVQFSDRVLVRFVTSRR